MSEDKADAGKRKKILGLTIGLIVTGLIAVVLLGVLIWSVNSKVSEDWHHVKIFGVACLVCKSREERGGSTAAALGDRAKTCICSINSTSNKFCYNKMASTEAEKKLASNVRLYQETIYGEVSPMMWNFYTSILALEKWDSHAHTKEQLLSTLRLKISGQKENIQYTYLHQLLKIINMLEWNPKNCWLSYFAS